MSFWTLLSLPSALTRVHVTVTPPGDAVYVRVSPLGMGTLLVDFAVLSFHVPIADSGASAAIATDESARKAPRARVPSRFFMDSFPFRCAWECGPPRVPLPGHVAEVDSGHIPNRWPKNRRRRVARELGETGVILVSGNLRRTSRRVKRGPRKTVSCRCERRPQSRAGAAADLLSAVEGRGVSEE